MNKLHHDTSRGLEANAGEISYNVMKANILCLN